MQCLYPVEMGSNKFPCGKCNFCLQRKRADWSFRLRREFKHAINGKFVTLTYDDSAFLDVKAGRVSEHGEAQLQVKDVQKFLKKVRWYQAKQTDRLSLRFFAVGEYGSITDRPHYHLLMFNVHYNVVAELPKIWGLGHCHIGEVSDASIHYVTKYVINKADASADRAPPFSTQSRRPGIGYGYLQTHSKYHINGRINYTVMSGFKSSLPRYYRDRIFNEEERALLREESLALQKETVNAEFDRLRKFVDDPYAHYAERVLEMYADVKSKEKVITPNQL